MTNKEAERAMIAAVPVVHNGITYEKLSGLIYRWEPRKKGYTIQAELLDKCGHSIVIASLGRIELEAGDPSMLPEIFSPNEDGPGPWELNAKAALKTARVFTYMGEPHRVSAIILRSWVEHDYWLYVELSRLRDGHVSEDWAGCVPPLILKK